MPCSPAKARLLLKEKKAVVRHRTPFTIQLTQATGETVQPVTLGVDAGSKFIGLSASTEKRSTTLQKQNFARKWWICCLRVGRCAEPDVTARRVTVLPGLTIGFTAKTRGG